MRGEIGLGCVHGFLSGWAVWVVSWRSMRPPFLKSRRTGKSLPPSDVGLLESTTPSNGHWSTFRCPSERFLMPIRNFSDGHQNPVRWASEFHRIPAYHRTGLPLGREPSAFVDPLDLTIFPHFPVQVPSRPFSPYYGIIDTQACCRP